MLTVRESLRLASSENSPTAQDMTQVVEHLLSKHKALSSIPQYCKNKTKSQSHKVKVPVQLSWLGFWRAVWELTRVQPRALMFSSSWF
jgi:hypothetical protein